jgi:hypothetical protein
VTADLGGTAGTGFAASRSPFSRNIRSVTMRSSILALASAAALFALPTLALATDQGAAAGATAGAVGGAVVGGPVGAVVGAGAGAAVGGATSGPNRPDVVIEHRGAATTGSVGCSSTTVHKENTMGDSKTVQKKEC